jgi:hypothetical protein
MFHLFSVESFTYDDDNDLLTAEVFLARSTLDDPKAPLTEVEDATERFHIETYFSGASASIRCTSDHEVGEFEQHYAPSVMVAFLKEFDRRYHQLSHECSPGDVLPFQFNVEL